MKTVKQDVDVLKKSVQQAISAAGVLGAWVLGENVVKSEDELDVLFDAVIDLLELARDERYRLPKVWVKDSGE